MLDPAVPASQAVPAPQAAPSNGAAEPMTPVVPQVAAPQPQAATQPRPTTGQAVPLSMDPVASMQQPAAPTAAAPPATKPKKKGLFARAKDTVTSFVDAHQMVSGLVAGAVVTTVVTNARNNRPQANGTVINGTIDRRDK